MNRLPTRQLSIYILIVLVLGTRSLSQPFGHVNANELLGGSSVVVVGRTSSIILKGRKQLDHRGADIAAMSIAVTKVLKGELNTQNITFAFLLPDEPIGYRGVPPGASRMVFLRKEDDGLVVSNPFVPSLPVCPSLGGEEAELPNQIVGYLISALACNALNESERLEALDYLRGERTQSTTLALDRALPKTANVRLIHLSIIAELLRRDDIRGLSDARQALESGRQAIPQFLYLNLAYAIGELHDRKAVPILSEMLQISDPIVRKSVVAALRNSKDSAAVSALTKALWDNDFEIRYYAVIGLAEITNQPDWRPLQETFQADEQKYLSYWRNWAHLYSAR